METNRATFLAFTTNSSLLRESMCSCISPFSWRKCWSKDIQSQPDSTPEDFPAVSHTMVYWCVRHAGVGGKAVLQESPQSPFTVHRPHSFFLFFFKIKTDPQHSAALLGKMMTCNKTPLQHLSHLSFSHLIVYFMFLHKRSPTICPSFFYFFANLPQEYLCSSLKGWHCY